MILSILATVAVLAAIAVIAAALVFAETALVYIALGLGALSVLLLLGALLQGRFGADRTDTARTDGLGKSSVPAAPAAVPGPTWESEQPGRVPAPAEEPVRDTPVPEPRPWGEEPQEEPEFDVPRWETPTKGDWPEPFRVAQTPPRPDQDESEEAPASAFAYRIPERDLDLPATTDPGDEDFEPSQSDAHAAEPQETFEPADDTSEAGSDDDESADTVEPVGASAAFTHLDPEPPVEDEEPTETAQDVSVEPQETSEGFDDHHGSREPAEASVRDEADEVVEDVPVEGPAAEETAEPEGDAPEAEADTVETFEPDEDEPGEVAVTVSDEDVDDDPDRSAAFERPEPVEDVQDEDETDEVPEEDEGDEEGPDRIAARETDTDESFSVDENVDDDPDRTATSERSPDDSEDAEDEASETDEVRDPEEDVTASGEGVAVAYAAIFDESAPEGDENGPDEAEERPKDPSHTN